MSSAAFDISVPFNYKKNKTSGVIQVSELKGPTPKEGSKCVSVCASVHVAPQSITEITLASESALRQETTLCHLLTHFHRAAKHTLHDQA